MFIQASGTTYLYLYEYHRCCCSIYSNILTCGQTNSELAGAVEFCRSYTPRIQQYTQYIYTQIHQYTIQHVIPDLKLVSDIQNNPRNRMKSDTLLSNIYYSCHQLFVFESVLTVCKLLLWLAYMLLHHSSIAKIRFEHPHFVFVVFYVTDCS